MLHKGAQWIHDQMHLLYHLPEEVKHFYELALAKQLLSASVGVFVPIYLFAQTGNVTIPLLYLTLAWGFFSAPMSVLNAHLLRRWGVERVMYMGILGLIVESLLVALFPISSITLLFLALAEAVNLTTYWDAFHLSFGVFGRKRRQMEEVADLGVLMSLVTIVAPMIMAALVIVLGYHYAFAVMLVVGVGLSTYLLKHFGKRHTVQIDVSKVFAPPYRWTWFVSGGYFLPMGSVPVLAFYVAKENLEKLGIFLSIVGLAAALIAIYIAQRVEKRKEYHLALVSPLGNAMIFLLYPHVGSVYVLLGLEVLRQIVSVASIAIYGALYTISKASPEILIGRNVYIHMGRGLAGTLMLLLGGNFPQIFSLGFLFGVLYAIGIYGIIRRLHAAS